MSGKAQRDGNDELGWAVDAMADGRRPTACDWSRVRNLLALERTAAEDTRKALDAKHDELAALCGDVLRLREENERLREMVSVAARGLSGVLAALAHLEDALDSGGES